MTKANGVTHRKNARRGSISYSRGMSIEQPKRKKNRTKIVSPPQDRVTVITKHTTICKKHKGVRETACERLRDLKIRRYDESYDEKVDSTKIGVKEIKELSHKTQFSSINIENGVQEKSALLAHGLARHAATCSPCARLGIAWSAASYSSFPSIKVHGSEWISKSIKQMKRWLIVDHGTTEKEIDMMKTKYHEKIHCLYVVLDEAGFESPLDYDDATIEEARLKSIRL
ncbi:hypothetical protein HAX54_045084 [Datura stramonium]|uniref:Uncharacterized protein n=1 Tax=Datura stramonium TaxID=4076 RepID=A0ABS8WHM3_DATST|nr:hypothetical protein [Datura stramonium]